MSNMNNSKVLTSVEPINPKMGGGNIDKVILKIWIQNVPSSI